MEMAKVTVEAARPLYTVVIPYVNSGEFDERIFKFIGPTMMRKSKAVPIAIDEIIRTKELQERRLSRSGYYTRLVVPTRFLEPKVKFYRSLHQ